MISQQQNNMKLGVFVLSALLITITGLYLIGKNQGLFGSNFELKAQFSNLSGLTKGNNVLYSGLQAGTVKNINVVNDTTFEVSMLIDESLKPFLHANAQASIGTEGLMGNKIVQITPGRGESPVVKGSDILKTKSTVAVDEMLKTLSKTNENILQISEMLKLSVLRVNSSKVWTLLEDDETTGKLLKTIANISAASNKANKIANDLGWIVAQTRSGKGTAGVILTDTAFAGKLSNTIAKLNAASNHAEELTQQLNQAVSDFRYDLRNGPGLAHALLKDSVLTQRLADAILNIEKGTDGFNQNMEALKHNFLLRGYFKKLEKKAAKK